MAILDVRKVFGVVGSLPFDPVDYCILAAGTAIAWAYCFELTLLTFYTFRRWSGLYFYSLLISSWGCTFHALGFILKFLTNTPSACFLFFIETGWVAMVSGQSFVLYSRLHLVVRRQRTLRLVLAMIITDGILLHTPTIVLTIGSNSRAGQQWAPIFNVMERIQLTVFCIQEFAISTIYIVHTIGLLGSIYHSRTRTVMIQLIIINSICLSMDAVLMGLEYANHYVGETSLKAMLYAIKLKLEFAVLNQLMSLTHAGMTQQGRAWQCTTGAEATGHRRRVDNDQGLEAQKTALSPPLLAPEKSTPSWSMAPVIRGSFSKGSRWKKKKGAPTTTHQEPESNRIARTQRIEVVSEPRAAAPVRDPVPFDFGDLSERTDEEEEELRAESLGEERAIDRVS